MDAFAGKDLDESEWDLPALRRDITQVFGLSDTDYEEIGLTNKSSEELRDMLWERVEARYTDKEKIVPADLLRRVERDLMLQIVDAQWKDHLYSLDHLKEGIGLRGYGQRDPLVEYKKESFVLFQDMRGRMEEEIVRYLWWLRPVVDGEDPAAPPVRAPRPASRKPTQLSYNDPSAARAPAFVGAGAAATAGGGGATASSRAPQPARVGGDDAPLKTVKRDEPKVGRNDLCPCGSGKKYKKCHGA